MKRRSREVSLLLQQPPPPLPPLIVARASSAVGCAREGRDEGPPEPLAPSASAGRSRGPSARPTMPMEQQPQWNHPPAAAAAAAAAAAVYRWPLARPWWPCRKGRRRAPSVPLPRAPPPPPSTSQGPATAFSPADAAATGAAAAAAHRCHRHCLREQSRRRSHPLPLHRMFAPTPTASGAGGSPPVATRHDVA